MPSRILCLFLCAAGLVIAAPPAVRAQDAADGAADVAEPVETSHAITLDDGTTLAYTARAGFLPLRDESGELLARVFHVAYTLEGADDPASRPVTFVFNGGPGSSSVWLHLGAAGPMRVAMTDEGEAPTPPGRLIVNEGTWLAATDLVFIDPVGTGYSRPAEGHEQSEFSGLENDARSVAEFIRLWTTRHGRWASPKFLAGESYGTTRAAALARRLQSAHNLYLNGVVLISSILDFGTARFDTGNDLPYALFLPTYTATAWTHGRLPEDLQSGPLEAALAESRAFALGDYWLALARGASLTAADRARVARRLARLTGLDAEYIEQANLRVSIGRFTKQLRRDERRTVGRLDSRFLGIDRDAAGESFEYDPSLAAISGAYAAALNEYVRRALGFESDLPYEILTGRVRPWPWGRDSDQGYVNVAEDLRAAMTRNPHMRVHIASGYYDLATPFFATEYTVDHLGLEPELRGNISMSYYESGHMMYIHEPSLRQLRRRVERFIAGAVAAGSPVESIP
ncbi:MAG: peptidase S10 [Planctomycetota bacterium]|nr:MAG: peptidase S10 [Planctomycetota bacterium]